MANASNQALVLFFMAMIAETTALDADANSLWAPSAI